MWGVSRGGYTKQHRAMSIWFMEDMERAWRNWGERYEILWVQE
jgi:hypothetical protein